MNEENLKSAGQNQPRRLGLEAHFHMLPSRASNIPMARRITMMAKILQMNVWSTNFKIDQKILPASPQHFQELHCSSRG